MVKKFHGELTGDFEKDIENFDRILQVKENFDIIRRDLVIAGKRAAFYFIDGFVKDGTMLKLMMSFLSVGEKDMPENAEGFSHSCVPYVEVDILRGIDSIVRDILSGVTCLFIEGYGECIAIDCRTYPTRGIKEPEKDKSLRGSRDGFVETVVFNTALIRRRIRDPNLIMEMTEAGALSRTDIALCYMRDKVDQRLLTAIRGKINSLDIGDLRMNQQSLAEAMLKRRWFNPFPKYKFTERPDTAAACILEGKIAILVDNAPSAMILPTGIFDMIEEANDYYFPCVTGIYLKVTRAIISLLTVFMTPFFLLLMQNPAWLPEIFSFIKLKDAVNIPLIFQLLILELSIDGLRLAALNTPSMLSTPLSVIAGIVMGEFSVKSGWFNTEVMLYMAFVAVANYTQPNFELGYALKFSRLFLLVMTALFDAAGFVIGSAAVLGLIVFNKTLSGKTYLD